MRAKVRRFWARRARLTASRGERANEASTSNAAWVAGLGRIYFEAQRALATDYTDQTIPHICEMDLPGDPRKFLMFAFYSPILFVVGERRGSMTLPGNWATRIILVCPAFSEGPTSHSQLDHESIALALLDRFS